MQATRETRGTGETGETVAFEKAPQNFYIKRGKIWFVQVWGHLRSIVGAFDRGANRLSQVGVGAGFFVLGPMGGFRGFGAVCL